MEAGWFGCFSRVIRCFLRGVIDFECTCISNAYMRSPISTAKGLRSSFLASTYKSESITPRCIIATGKVRAFHRVVETSTFDLARLAVQVNRNFSIKYTNVYFYFSIL